MDSFSQSEKIKPFPQNNLTYYGFNQMHEGIKIYTFSLGIVLVLIGIVDLVVPEAVIGLWERWASKKLFFLHGILLIVAGFPLTIYRGPLSGILFIIGLVPVLTGPFVLIYPDKFRRMFGSMSEEMNSAAIKKMTYIEGALLIGGGAVCIVSFILST
jgi:uncharacterized protein YjeT (DUF2065 family)